jgi:hypothetical protein
VSLSAVLYQAVTQNLCWAYLPQDDVNILRQIINVPNDGLIDMADPQGADRDALPWGGDKCVNWDYNPYEIANASQLLQDYFVSTGRLLCNSSEGRPELGPRGVVLHMRSGDIMEYWTQGGKDPQPPCEFYVSVVEEGNNGTAFDHVLIVTQPDFRNPCIAAVKRRFPSKIRVQSRSVTEDACMIATAQNVATGAFSTFDTGLLRLNTRLKNIYVPMGEESDPKRSLYTHYYTWGWWPKHFTYWLVRDEGMPYAQHVYSFPNYNTYWRNWDDRVASMVNYPRENILKRSIPAISKLTM